MQMDERDRMILRLLQKDGRISNAELADKVNLSASACLRRVRLLEEAGFIDHYTMLLNPVRIGKPGNAFVNIAINRQTREALETFEKEVQKVPEVVECYLLAGQSDYLVHCRLRTHSQRSPDPASRCRTCADSHYTARSQADDGTSGLSKKNKLQTVGATHLGLAQGRFLSACQG